MERLHLNVLSARTLEVDVLHRLSMQRPPRNGRVHGVATELQFGRTPDIPFMVPIDVMHSEPQMPAVLLTVVPLHDLCPQKAPVEIAIINEVVLLQSHYRVQLHRRGIWYHLFLLIAARRTRDIQHLHHVLPSLTHCHHVHSASTMPIASLLFSGISVLSAS